MSAESDLGELSSGPRPLAPDFSPMGTQECLLLSLPCRPYDRHTRPVLSTFDQSLNELSPILRLPPELLNHIFVFVFHDDRLWHDTLGWIHTTHVCRRLRQVALNNPHLWRNVCFPMHSARAEAMLSRSRPVPLIVTWNGRSPSQQAALISHLVRVEELQFQRYGGSADHLVALLSTPAPFLKTAKLPLPIMSRLSYAPVPLFGGCAPRLRHLSMRSFAAFPWDSPILRNLVYLEIEEDRHTPFTSFSPSDVVRGLQRMPALETLMLKHCLPPFPNMSAPSDPSQADMIAHAHLKTLLLSGRLVDCVGLLQRLHIPWATVALSLDCKTPGRADAFAALFPFLARADGTQAQRIRGVEIEAQMLQYFALEAFRHPASPAPSDRPPLALSLSLSWDDVAGWTAADLALAVCGALDLARVLYAIVKATGFLRSAWVRAFGGAAQLRSIEATAESGATLCQALPLSSAGDGVWRSADGGTVLWPRLESVSLGYLSFARAHAEDPRPLHDVLARALRIRREAVPRPLQMYVYQCRCRDEWRRDLETMVEELWWEEKDGVDESESGESDL